MIARSTAKQITLEALVAMFDEEVHPLIRGNAASAGVSHIVVCEVLQMDSSSFGKRVALSVGPDCTFTLDHVLDTPHFRLGNVPSRFQYPTHYAPAKEDK